jgi:diaminopimelate decarboxylase
MWVEKNLKQFPPKKVIITGNKAKYAQQSDGTPNILIDDFGQNIDKWNAAGGIGVKHKDHKFERTFKELMNHLKKDEKQTENFADGKVKGKSRPGRVKRAGASCDGSVTDLRKKAKNASGEKAKMYHWCANMKSGRNK